LTLETTIPFCIFDRATGKKKARHRSPARRALSSPWLWKILLPREESFSFHFSSSLFAGKHGASFLAGRFRIPFPITFSSCLAPNISVSGSGDLAPFSFSFFPVSYASKLISGPSLQRGGVKQHVFPFEKLFPAWPIVGQ